MNTMLQNWKGSLEVNGKHYDSFQAFKAANTPLSGVISIKLYPEGYTAVKPENNDSKTDVKPMEQASEFIITVKKYMTEKSNPRFDFMAKWNNDNPMPLRTMVGVKVKETPGMVYMKLHGDILAEKTCTCMKCGRVLTNEVSQYFGIGPECGNHGYVNPFNTEEELHEAVSNYKKKLQAIEWEGWIIKSAITEEERR